MKKSDHDSTLYDNKAIKHFNSGLGVENAASENG